MEHNFYRRYTGSYLAVYVVLTMLYAATAYVPVLAARPDSLNFLIAMISAYLPARLFAKDHERLPDKTEKQRFATLGLIAVTIFSAIALVLVWRFLVLPEDKEVLLAELSIVPIWIFTIVLILVTGFYYLLTYWTFGWMVGLQLKAIKKDREKRGRL